MLPSNEIDTLTMTVVDAIDLAANGQLAGGYAALLAGLHRAEEIAEEGIKWGAELADRWRLACDNHAKEYGVRLD